MVEPASRNPGRQILDTAGSMFLGASGVNIHGGTFNAYGSDGIENQKKIAAAMELLDSRAEEGAPYDAAARDDLPKCHENTRVAIIDGIDRWAHSEEPGARPLMWMYGPAGSGKTTIMQTVAEKFDQEESLAVSFFFSRLSAARPKNKKNFVITLAHQLAIRIPDMQEPLAQALSDKSILTKSLAKQLDALIIGPLNKLNPTQIGSCRIFLVDGLDECDGDTAQRDVLDLLERMMHHTRHRLRILVASRTLSHIQAFFSQRAISELMQSTPLDNDYQSDKDVEKFLISKFNKIRQEHPSRYGLSSEWPLSSNVDALVKRASGQFIYASVVMKSIGDHSRHPNETLQAILGLTVNGDASPYEQLDAVYAQVLSSIEPHNLEFVKTFFGCLLTKGDFSNTPTTIPDTDSFFMLEPGTTQARINRVSPLIQPRGESTNGQLEFSHASFPDYLLDQSRSNEHFVDLQAVHGTLALHWFDHYTKIVELKRFLFNTYQGNSGDLIRHCMKAEWTPGLSKRVLAFDLETLLVPSPETVATWGQHLEWDVMVLWLCFIFWMQEKRYLSLAETDVMLDRIHIIIQSVHLELSIPPTLIRIAAVVFTICNEINISPWWFVDDHPFGQSKEWTTSKIFQYWPDIFHSDIWNTSSLWLCNALGGSKVTNGLLTPDATLYTEFAVRFVETLGTARFDIDWRGRDLAVNKWVINIPIILTKTLPSNKLASLVQKNLHFPKNSFAGEVLQDTIHDYFRAICIYLFECGIPFHSEHQHPPPYHPDTWYCGICELFNSFSSEHVDIELSQDPGVKPAIQPAPIADEGAPEPLQINPLQRLIRGVPLLWLPVWIAWFADVVLRFFPVFA